MYRLWKAVVNIAVIAWCHYTRGEEINRPFDDVLHEIDALAEQGVKEITLLGQNVNAYRGPMHDGATADLALLNQLYRRNRWHRADSFYYLPPS